MKKVVLIVLAAIGIIGLGVIFAQQVSAGDRPRFGFGSQRRLENKAEVLGMTPEELETELEEKTMFEIFEEKGIDREQFHVQMKEKVRGHWQEMGLSEEEIVEREQKMEERHQKVREHCLGWCQNQQ